MCGIAGFTQFNQTFGDKKSLKIMGEAIIHRGPDAGGEYLEKNIGLCHRRLSIIDLSSVANQPLVSDDEQYIIAFNGEIYNFLDLRKELESNGYSFKTHSDTEVLLRLYQKYGTACLDKINGMFAFAIWDKQKQQLFIARDRIGKKPLYYYTKNNDVIFASELKAMLAINLIPKDIRIDAVYDFFAYQYIPDPKTIFNDVYKLEPGHFLIINESGLIKEKYWDISFKSESSESEEKLTSQLKEVINDCTKSRMLADVPLGAFLSGGVDSSGIVANMANSSKQAVTTCSIGFDTKQFNETEFAQTVAKQYKTDHHELIVHQNVNDNLADIVKYFDEPFADPSLVPTFFVSQLAKQKVTVAISGDGGDEIFAGYEKYSVDHIENKLRQIFPSFIRKGVFPIFEKTLRLFNNRLCKKGATLLNTLSQNADMGFYLSNSQITDKEWAKIATPQTKKNLNHYHPSEITLKHYNDCDASDHLNKILYTDMKTYLPGGILVKVDRMSMANSLEVRAPILDYKVIEFSATIPSNLKFKKGVKKHILKEAFKSNLNDEILYRKKMGFSVPLAEWLRGEIKNMTEETILNAKNGIPTYFNLNEIKILWDEHQAKIKDHSTLLWSLLMFQMWWNNYMDDVA